MQTGLDERVIEYRVVFATCHKAEARQIREHRPSAILAVEPRASRVPAGAAAL